MKNILINIISLNIDPARYNSPEEMKNDKMRGFKEYNVESGLETVKAHQTNEACFKCVEKLLEQKEERVDAIISLVSELARNEKKFYDRDKQWKKKELKNFGLTLSNYEWFKKAVNDYFYGKYAVTFSEIRIEDAQRNNTDEFTSYINEIFKIVNKFHNEKPRIIFDVSGGKRDISNLLQLISKLFQYRGYEVASYYTELNDNKGVFLNCNELYRQLEILAIVNDFIQSGNVFHFYDYFKNSGSKSIWELSHDLMSFNQAMLLCSINDIYSSIDVIKQDIDSINREQPNNTDIRTLQMMTGLLRDKFHLHKRDTPMRDLGVIQWCMDNKMYQQAVTICYERIPVFMVMNGLIGTSEKRKADEDTAVGIMSDYVNGNISSSRLSEQDKEFVASYHTIYKIRNQLNHALKRDKVEVDKDIIENALKDILKIAENAYQNRKR